MEFKLIESDDWAGLYKNGILVAQGHHVSLAELAAAAGLNFSTQYVDYKSNGQLYLFDHGEFPSSLDEWEAEVGN